MSPWSMQIADCILQTATDKGTRTVAEGTSFAEIWQSQPFSQALAFPDHVPKTANYALRFFKPQITLAKTQKICHNPNLRNPSQTKAKGETNERTE